MKRIILVVCFALALQSFFGIQANAKDEYKVAWSHYTGWEPWAYIEDSGILKKWADKENISIKLSPPLDYIESINLYTAGEYDACVMTNMDVLSIPCAGGIDSTVLIIGDYSNGNDGIVVKNGNTVNDLKGRNIKLVELSVSHYLLARALEQNNLRERDVNLINTSDSDIAALFLNDSDPNAVCVTWNPLLMQIRTDAAGANMVFDSSKIPGEILDLLIVKTAAPEPLKRALVGAWYEAMNIIEKPKSPEGQKAIEFMAKMAGGTVQQFLAQLKTTAMFYTPKGSVDLYQNPKLKETMDYVRTFCFDHGLLAGADSKDDIGILFPDGNIMGDKENVKLRFNVTYTKNLQDKK